MIKEYISYLNQSLDRSQIIQLAEQYKDSDMWDLYGICEDNFPFVIKTEAENEKVILWNKYNGMVDCPHQDPVFLYAFSQWLIDNVHPVFASFEEAQDYAIAQDWPRKSLDAE